MRLPRALTLGAAAVSVFFAGISFYFAFTFRFAAGITGNSTFTVDQVLAALTLSVTLLGVIVAITAIGIGAAAIFGFAELRTITYRKTEEQLKKIIDKLQESGDLPAAQATILKSAIQLDGVNLDTPSPRKQSGASVEIRQNATAGRSKKAIAEQYPKRSGPKK